MKEGSVARGDNLQVRFDVTDGKQHDPGRLSGPAARSVPRRAGRGDRRRARSGRHLQGRQRARQARRELHAEGGRRRLKQQGHWKDDDGKKTGTAGKGTHAVIPELGHYALVLALALGARAGLRAALRRAAQRSGADGDRRCRPRWRSSSSSAISFAALTARLRRLGFLRRQRVREFAFAEAADLQDHRRVGEPRRLDAAVGADPRAVRRAGRAVRRQSAGDAQGQRAGGAVVDRGRLHPVHPADLEPVPAAGAGARSKAATSIRSCRTPASRSIRRCSTSAMSGSRSRSRSRSRR